MNNFTKDELSILHLDVNTEINKHKGILKPSPSHLALRDKLEKMIEDYNDQETEIYSCHTGIGVGDEFFHDKQHMTAEDLMPAVHQLVNQCDGMIKEPGIYAMRLTLVKLK